ncbi:uncharacterized protein LOC115953015 [Quercus lobata]|uniref:uncharacterized protein LOC115953015 n=1 Tax=Quercus lobata TaxID=97700 RepID=UPI00124941C5|nr:uncharacterized protein LOC115953015 [Quercus lobata]
MDLICRLGQEGRNVELFTVMAWFIWCRRNKCHFNEPSIPVDKLLEAALKSLSEFQSKQLAGTTHQKPAMPKWQPPPKDTYKINYDGAIFLKSEEAGIGVVIKNERGEVMASLAEKVNKPSGGVGAIEAMAVRRAILLAVELGFQQCVVEGDLEIVFKALSREGSNQSSFGHTIKDYKSIMGLLKTCSF